MKKRHIYFNTSANTSQDLPWHHKRDTRKAAHPAGTAKSNRQALRRLNRLGITDIAIDPESLAPKKKRKKEMGKTLNLADCPVHSLPIEWRLAITKGRQAPDMGIDLGGSVDVDEAFGSDFDGGFDEGFDEFTYNSNDMGKAVDQSVGSPALSSAASSAKVHEDKEVFLASPSFPDGKDISNEVSTGEDITEVPIGNQHDIVEPREDTYLPSKQNVKAPVPRKATPEKIAPLPKAKSASASTAKNTSNASSKIRNNASRSKQMHLRSARASSSAPCSLCGLRRVEGFVIKSPREQTLSKKVSP